MNRFLKKTLHTYLLFMGILIFASTILSPDFQGKTLFEFLQNGSALIVYRLTIFSIFALLFATLFSLQSFERQNVSIAISMSGKHSFAILRPIFLFAIGLSTLCVISNAYLLGPAIQQLGRDNLITSHKNLKVFEVEEGTLFFSENFVNFCLITKEKEIYFSNKAIKTKDGFLLENMEHFVANGSNYEKTQTEKNFLLPIDTSPIKPFSTLMLSAPLQKLVFTFLEEDTNTL
ncbi:LptF/LptG family permease, partial [bacterium]|nr:LptF/LptG family permease [bacterium]